MIKVETQIQRSLTPDSADLSKDKALIQPEQLRPIAGASEDIVLKPFETISMQIQQSHGFAQRLRKAQDRQHHRRS